MTDTRITVDVSTEALLQRARQQQAQSRQAAIQREEERKEVERQKRDARKAGRNQPPGQDRLKGRSKLRGMAPRHEVAAGYVSELQVGMCFCALTYDEDKYGYTNLRLTTSKDKLITSRALEQSYSGPDSGYEGTLTISIFPEGGKWGDAAFGPLPNYHLSDMEATNAGYPPVLNVQSGTVASVNEGPKVLIFPVGGNVSLLVVLVKRISLNGPTIVETFRSPTGLLIGTPNDFINSSAPAQYVFRVGQIGGSDAQYEITYSATCFVASDNKSRQVQCPSALVEFLNAKWPYQIPGVSQGLGIQTGENVPYEPYPESFGFTLGTPRTISAANNAMISEWSKQWLQFSLLTSTSEQFTCRKITELDPTTKEPIDLASGRVMSKLAKPVRPASMQGLQPVDTYFPLIAWDWGKPQLCRRLLLQLGFKPEDLRP